MVSRKGLEKEKSFGLRVQGSVQGAGFRVQGSGCRVQGSGFRVQGSGLTFHRLGCRVEL